jgi:hypothetical protein
MSESGPIQGQGSSHFSRCPQTYSRLKERSTVESPQEEASSPRVLPNGPEIHTTTLWRFWRAPPWPPADPYRTGHGLPLELPASNSPEIVETHPSMVVRRSHPSSLPKGCVRVKQLKNEQNLDRSHAHEARGFVRNRLAPTKEGQTRLRA